MTLLATGCQRQQPSPSAAAIDPNKYYAVLLNNNSVYFGKLEGFDSEFPVLRDVYYVQSNVNQDTKQVNNVLFKRGKECLLQTYPVSYRTTKPRVLHECRYKLPYWVPNTRIPRPYTL